ncbi:MAG TPA: patatin-like phospholipase family protein, partial [Gammaproteobacteria bacterium]
MSLEYSTTADVVIEAEKSHIRKDFEDLTKGGAEKKQDFLGLAFSGGGIRSASFCLGVMQALVGGGILKKIDYLSTVSGGGYIGSALTWFLNRGMPDGSPAGTDPDNFPLGHARTGARNQKQNPNVVLDFLRQHGCYLTPGNKLDFISLLGYSARTIFVSFLVYFAVLTLVIGLLKIPGFLFKPPFPNPDHMLACLPNWYFLGAVVLAGLFVAASILYSVLTWMPLGSTSWRYTFRFYNQAFLGILIKWSLALLVVGSLPLVHELLLKAKIHIEAAGGTTVLGGFIGWLQYFRQQRNTKEEAPKGSEAISIIAAILIIYGLLLGAYILTEYIGALPKPERIAWSTGILVAVFLLGFCVNINYAGMHRMYRDRLMETFMPDPASANNNQWGFAREADKALIETMCRPPNRRPYHLVNTNLVLVDSDTAKYRGRGGDNFILSPLYCGSDASGWRKSSAYMKKSSRGITLSTAMAISGAAVNSNTAVAGRGISRNRWVSILLTLLNLRLGYWSLNPKFEGVTGFSPNFIVPGLLQSILFKGLKETQMMVELSDGGHFENLGLYELIRRKLKVIIACDSGADPKFTFDDLGNAIEKARVDFGAKIVFDDPKLDLRCILPGSGE